MYIKEKLRDKGIKAEAIYSHIDADHGSAEARNKRTQDDNTRILKEFKNGQIDVLINVRMLTEGADVPNVQTVFITRQTTSSILMTQMIGRALRGEKVGGSSEANVVLFFDDWKRLVDWANPKDGDTIDKDKTSVKGYYPLEYISIRLVEELSKSIESGGDYSIPKFSKIIPTGWYKTEIVYADSEDESETMETFTEFVMVYEQTTVKFHTFINFILSTKLSDEWSKEYLEDTWMQPQVEQWINKYFDRESDDIGQRLQSDLIKIVRHISQKQSAPPFHQFEEREIYDLDKIAEKVINFPSLEKYEYLNKEFSKSGTLWKTFYGSLNRFETAVDEVIRKIIHSQRFPKEEIEPTPNPVTPVKREPTEGEKIIIKARDGNACLCCGVNSREGYLQIDHIVPFSMGGKTSLENLQTLCNICNRYKGNNEIDFQSKKTQLKEPKNLDLSFPYKSQNIKRVITRIVNFFYHCKAVYKVNLGIDLTWEIHLYPGNDPTWLLKHKTKLLKFLQNELGYHVYNIKVIVID